MLDDRVRSVLARLEEEDARERAEGVPSEQRSRQIEPTTGRFLFAFVSHNAGCEVLEIGASLPLPASRETTSGLVTQQAILHAGRSTE